MARIARVNAAIAGHTPKTAGEPRGHNGAVSVDHYENFPVASLLCPPALRPAVVAIYHFARTADDIADEGDDPAETRLALLAAYRRDLDAVLARRQPSPQWPRVFVALSRCIQAFALPGALLHDLLDAFEQDVLNPLYPDRASLLAYCRRSANPIGRLMLHLYGRCDAMSLQRSDAICSALQLINFWQDLSLDGPRGRHYVPLADQRSFGVTPNQMRDGIDDERSQAMVRDLCGWARALMQQGAPLALQLPGRAGWELRFIVQGGLRVLDKIAAIEHRTLELRPTLSARDGPLLAWRALRMRN
jgi:squalene synthase HpnC